MTTIQIFLFLWNMMYEVELEAQVDNTANLEMVELEVGEVNLSPGTFKSH
jgi:hypothetical protein